MSTSPRGCYLTACASLIALIFLCLAWELKLAPIQAGGTWLVLKCLPLLAPLFGILNGRRYTYQWSSMLILLYLTEGVVRAPSAFTMIVGSPPSSTASAELVVPKSIPTARPMSRASCFLNQYGQ